MSSALICNGTFSNSNFSLICSFLLHTDSPSFTREENCSMASTPLSSSNPQYRQLELHIVSAQDLKKMTLFKKMETYAVAWINHCDMTSRLSTQIDKAGGSNPTWNDRFIFRVEESFLRSETSAVTIEIFCIGYVKDKLVGTARVMVSSLLKGYGSHGFRVMNFCALQVRLRSGRPQGILNLGATILDDRIHGLSSFNGGSLAVAFRDLIMGNMDSNCQPRPSSVVEKLFFMRSAPHQCYEKGCGDDEEEKILTSLPCCKKDEVQEDVKDGDYWLVEEKENKVNENVKRNSAGFCHSLLDSRLQGIANGALKNGPSKIHLSRSDENMCSSKKNQET